MSRLPELRVADLTESQRALFSIVKREPSEFVQGPIRALLLSPVVGEKVQSLGAVVHTGASFGARLTELAVLIVARAWSCQYEWGIHAPRAEKQGIAPEIIEAIRTRGEPKFSREDEGAIYSFVQALMTSQRVPDDVYQRAKAMFGETGVADLVGLLGYFVLLAITVNSFELGPPAGRTVSLPG